LLLQPLLLLLLAAALLAIGASAAGVAKAATADFFLLLLLLAMVLAHPNARGKVTAEAMEQQTHQSTQCGHHSGQFVGSLEIDLDGLHKLAVQ